MKSSPKRIFSELSAIGRRIRRYARRAAMPLSDAVRRRTAVAEIARFRTRPIISVILPVYNVDERWLRKCIESVTAQIYPGWELCVADDCSTRPHIRTVLEEYVRRDSRIRVVFRDSNGNISEASNSALGLATGEFSVLLDHDDELTSDAVFEIARTLNEEPNVEMIYSDEDKIDENGSLFHPVFKPDFSRDLMYSLNMVTHLIAYRTETIRRAGGFRKDYEGSQDYDLALRVIEMIDEDRIRHVPRILYHWRAISGSVALDGAGKPYAHERARRAIAEHFERSGIRAEVSATRSNYHRVRYCLPDPPPRVCLIAFGDGGHPEISDHGYPELQIVQSSPGADNLNAAAFGASADLFIFVNAAASPTDAGWLTELCGYAIQPGIGAVGGKIIDETGRVMFGGMIFGPAETVRTAHMGLERTNPGYLSRLEVANNVSAVSIDCLAVRREVFESFGGFDSEKYPDHLFDADFCLRLRERGYRIVFDPFAELCLNSERTRPAAARATEAVFRKQWTNVIERDPFSNPNFARTGRPFSF